MGGSSVRGVGDLAWTNPEDGVTLSQGNASAVAFIHPTPESRFFLKGMPFGKQLQFLSGHGAR